MLRSLRIRSAIATLLIVASSEAIAKAPSDPQQHHHGAGTERDGDQLPPVTLDMMSSHVERDGPHIRWTSRRSRTAQDLARADEIILALRTSLSRYQDYRVAEAEGFRLRHPERRAKHYHFGNPFRRREARWHFDPAKPTTLLYRKTADGFQLEGAMYTAPPGLTKDELNERIPLSVGQWHAHVNVCLAQDRSGRRLDLGPGRRRTPIASEEECERAGGRFVSQLGVWMIHVYPFESTREKIWTH